jgi:double-strand break repair protein MRE11
MDDNVIRIMIMTDNHLGYCERDPIRGNDSFASFEVEVPRPL